MFAARYRPTSTHALGLFIDCQCHTAEK